MNLADALEEAGLTGRGGAGFPTATKLRAAAEHGANVIVNACDGEPGARKDAWVVSHHLDEVVAGAALAAGRRSGRVRYAAHRGSATETALRTAGLDVLAVPHRYVSSEETSLISLAHGGLARPMTKRAPFVTGGRDSTGRRMRPTLVLNAETAWRISQVHQYGPAWFRHFGTPEQPGPRLVTVHGHVARPGVLATVAGVRLVDLLATVAPLHPESAVLVGGLAGGFLAADEVRGALWSDAGLASYGTGTGAGLIEVLDPRVCPLEDLIARLRYAAGESAGQCGPCMFGLPRLADHVAALVAHPDQAMVDQVHARIGLLPGRGACRFPDGIARFAASALRVHHDHLLLHAARSCPLRPVSSGSHHAAHA